MSDNIWKLIRTIKDIKEQGYVRAALRFAMQNHGNEAVQKFLRKQELEAGKATASVNKDKVAKLLTAGSMSREQLMKELKRKFNIISKPSEEFDRNDGGIWITDTEKVKGLPAFNYYSEDYAEKDYKMSVRKDIFAFIDKAGWFAEQHDPETWFLWEA